MPTARPSRGLLNMTISCLNSSISASGDMELLISSMPNIRTAKPMQIPPISFLRGFFDVIISIMPMKATIGENDEGFSRLTKKLSLSMPARLRTHAVIVVPMFEPMIMPTDCPSFRIPELTRPTSMTVTAEED